MIEYKAESKSIQEANEYLSLRQRKSANTVNNRLRNRQVRIKNLPNTIPTLVNGLTTTEVSTKHTRHNLKNNTQLIADHKIMIFGDSHTRSLAGNVKNNLDEKYKVCGFVKPGVNIATQISSIADTTLLTKNDLIIFWGGANDVNKNKTQEGLKHLVNFVQSNIHTNIFLCVPPDSIYRNGHV